MKNKINIRCNNFNNSNNKYRMNSIIMKKIFKKNKLMKINLIKDYSNNKIKIQKMNLLCKKRIT